MRTRLPAFVCCLLLAACCLLTAAAPLRADIKLTLDTKDGASISDIAKIVAHAESADNIDKVEFYVDDQLRFTAPSVPYAFTWDTIPDKEGMHTLAVTAFDSNGQTKKLSITLNIDNELALGGDALAKKADEALKANDLPTAMKYCRRALKAEPGNAEASRVLAGIYANEGDWDKAVTTLEKSNNAASNPTTMLRLATYKMRRALQPENAPIFFTELDSITSLRQQAADMHTAEVVKQNPDDTPPVTRPSETLCWPPDTITRRCWSIASPPTKTTLPPTSVNRYALANLYDGTPDEALEILHIAEVKARNRTRPPAPCGVWRCCAPTKYEEARAAVAADAAANYPAALLCRRLCGYRHGQVRPGARGSAGGGENPAERPETAYANSMTLQKINEQEDALNAASDAWRPSSPRPISISPPASRWKNSRIATSAP